MNDAFILGTRLDGGPLRCEVQKLVDTRLLVNANSGAGKSWCLRRILEQTHGRVQHLVIDPEGEFASLRERFDYVLAARHGGDTVADPRSAKLLAERLLELGVSAILDVYELKAHERVKFVRYFLEALVDAPKKLWHPALVVVDEAHVYMPEKGEAESAGAMIDLATRGRKRGFACVFATQRLSKLDKDGAAECNNILIGRSALDIDMKRAADALGLVGREEQHRLRELPAGEFFAFGPALCRTPTLVKIGDVTTTHPKAGARLAFTAPPPTAKVKALLPKLADLPAEAEERQRTVEELRRDLAQARRDLTTAKRQTPMAPTPKAIEVPTVKPADLKRLEKIVERIATMEPPPRLGALLIAATVGIDKLTAVMQEQRAVFERTLAPVSQAMRQVAAGRGADPTLPAPRTLPAPTAQANGSAPPRRAARAADSTPAEGLTGPEQRILDALGWFSAIGIDNPETTAVAFLAGYTPSGGGFCNPRGRLRVNGLVSYLAGDRLGLTDAGRSKASIPDAPLIPSELHDRVLRRLPGPEGKILRVLLNAYPDALTNEAAAAAAGYSPDGGGYCNPRGRLRSLGLIDYPESGKVVAKPLLFLEG